MANLKSSRILAGFLAFVMVVSMLPLSMFTTVSALELDSYSVRLTDGNDVLDLDDVEVTMTNKADENIAAAVNTVNGIAVFESFVEEEATYIVTVAEVFGYDIAASYEITVAVGEVSTDVVLTTLNKINISGIVTDENGDAYEGAKVAIGGYVTFETITDAEGKYVTLKLFCFIGGCINIQDRCFYSIKDRHHITLGNAICFKLTSIRFDRVHR